MMFTPAQGAYLQQIEIPVRIACVSTSGWPVVLSLWYLYRDGALYCATQQSARIVQYLRHEPKCAFEIAADDPPYCGVRGQGIATLDKAQGPAVLDALLVRYLGSTDNRLAQKLLAQSEREVAIVIRPVQVNEWNFTQRMQDAVQASREKICPS